MAQITIPALRLDNFHPPRLSGDVVYLRFYALQPFTARSTFQIIQPGAPGAAAFFQQEACSVVSGSLHLPEIKLESTTDALNPGDRGSRYFAGFFRPNGGLLQPYYDFEQFRLPSKPSVQTWAQIAAYNSPGVPQPPNYDTFTKDQINGIAKPFYPLPPFLLSSDEGGVVAVASWNLRTGEVHLLDTDVLAALGYTPATVGHTHPYLPLAGGALSGPLRLAGDPVLSNEAATRAYVLANAGVAVPVRGVWYVTNYNASGSGARFTGAITSGTNILTLTTSSHDFQVGQGICILGTGSILSQRGNYFVSLITAITGAQITLQDFAPGTVTATTDNVQHDDTVAVQNAINAVLNTDTHGGTLIFPDGTYRINKGFTDFNSILKIPYTAASSSAKSIFFKGLTTWRAGFLDPSSPPPPTSTSGISLKTELINTSGSMLSGGIYNGPGGDLGAENVTCIWMERMVWVTYDNPQINCVDLGMLGQFVQLRECVFATDAPNLGGSEPTHGTFALRLPQNNFSASTMLDLVVVAYNHIGCIASEQMDSWRLYVSRCHIALQFQPGYHLSRGHISPFQCPRLIEFAGSATGYPDNRVDLTMDVEVGGDPWMTPSGPWATANGIGEIWDPNNYGKGVIRYMALSSGAGSLTTISQNTGVGSTLQIVRIT